MKMTWKIAESRPKSGKSHSSPRLVRYRIRFTNAVGVRVKVVNEPALGWAGGVAVSELCVDDGAVGFKCAMGSTGGILRCISMAGKGASTRPPSITPSRCAVCGTGFTTPLWVVSGVIVGRKVVVVVVLCCGSLTWRGVVKNRAWEKWTRGLWR